MAAPVPLTRRTLLRGAAASLGSLSFGSRPARASELAAAGAVQAPSADAEPWSVGERAADDVRRGLPLVTVVVVPLCSNEQIWCGARWAGQPAGLRTNIYWGAQYGTRRFLERKGSDWQVTHVPVVEQPHVLEELVVRRSLDGTPWGRDAVEQIVVVRAFHGARIDEAVRHFHALATDVDEVPVTLSEQRQSMRLHIVGYAGHNRLMDGLRLPGESPCRAPKPAFVLACYSEKYFRSALEAAGVKPLLLTTTYVAPEGYLTEAVLRATGENLSKAAIRTRAVQAYARWQRLPPARIDSIFSR